MIRQITINNFRGIESEVLDIKPLTLLTGLNSTGKSTFFQAILTSLYYNNGTNANIMLSSFDFSFATNRNRNVNAKSSYIEVVCDNGESFETEMLGEYKVVSKKNTEVDLEDSFYYLSANRLAFNQDMETVSPKYKVGVQGEYIFGSFETEKSRSLDVKLVKDKNSETLSAQLNWWLTYILGIKFELETEKITSNRVKVIYKSNNLPNLAPQQLGVGVSYLAKILITCLRAKKGDTLMLENPEIHLHPAAQSRLGEFFVYITNAGIQLLIETHCENLLNKIQYEVYKNHINHTDAVLYYKGGITDPFQRLDFMSNGKFNAEFPEGFFDATLVEMLEMD
ncbi:MAG: AAA family ATPase [Bacteroidaceae bacterium]|nr:AAA family ATPase [Bacteroidaceae bacterium]